MVLRNAPRSGRPIQRLTPIAIALLFCGALLFALVVMVIEGQAARRTELKYFELTAETLSTSIETSRDFYSQVILKKLHGSGIEFSHDYREKKNVLPIPATMSLDLIQFYNERKALATMRLVSDYPFPWRKDRQLGEFDSKALESFRKTSNSQYSTFVPGVDQEIFEYAVPIRLGENCVACHNSHPDSPKRDWKIGDLRGIQVVSLPQSSFISYSLHERSYLIAALLIFFSFTGLVVAWLVQRNQIAFRQILIDQKDLARARDQAERANQAKTDFLAHMSHELRTPLNSILGHAQLLSQSLVTEAFQGSLDQITQLKQIERSGWHLLGLIEEVLDLSKIEAGNKKIDTVPLALGELLDNCLLLIENEANNRQIKLHAPVINCAKPYALGNATNVRQILLNLLSNAVKYNIEGGYISTFIRDGAEGRVQIAVRDSGRGLSSSELELIFKPFTRFIKKDEVVPGSGIGLALSKRLAELMGGRLEVTSEKDKGSEFILELQASAEPVQETKIDAAGFEFSEKHQANKDWRADDEQEKIKVLYIEDVVTNFEIVRIVLERQGNFEVIPACDGENGLLLAKSLKPDVILLDMGLPGMGGMEVQAALAADPVTSQIPVIALSASALKEQVEQARIAGFFDYLTKPLQFPRLFSALKAAISSKRPEKS